MLIYFYINLYHLCMIYRDERLCLIVCLSEPLNFNTNIEFETGQTFMLREVLGVVGWGGGGRVVLGRLREGDRWQGFPYSNPI